MSLAMAAAEPPASCVFCGKPIPLPNYDYQRQRTWYCSRPCAGRQQRAIKLLRDTSPPAVAQTPIDRP